MMKNDKTSLIPKFNIKNDNAINQLRFENRNIERRLDKSEEDAVMLKDELDEVKRELRQSLENLLRTLYQSPA